MDFNTRATRASLTRVRAAVCELTGTCIPCLLTCSVRTLSYSIELQNGSPASVAALIPQSLLNVWSSLAKDWNLREVKVEVYCINKCVPYFSQRCPIAGMQTRCQAPPPSKETISRRRRRPTTSFRSKRASASLCLVSHRVPALLQKVRSWSRERVGATRQAGGQGNQWTRVVGLGIHAKTRG